MDGAKPTAGFRLVLEWKGGRTTVAEKDAGTLYRARRLGADRVLAGRGVVAARIELNRDGSVVERVTAANAADYATGAS
jgi:hypothetical protein